MHHEDSTSSSPESIASASSYSPGPSFADDTLAHCEDTASLTFEPYVHTETELQILVANASRAIHQSISENLELVPRSTGVFDERAYNGKILPVRPSFGNVAEFMERAVQRAGFGAGVIVGTVILFRRVSAQSSVQMYSWRILLLLTILICQKVIEDQPLRSDQFMELFAHVTMLKPTVVLLPQKIIEMELQLLKNLDFRVNIKYIEYKACHRELRI